MFRLFRFVKYWWLPVQPLSVLVVPPMVSISKSYVIFFLKLLDSQICVSSPPARPDNGSNPINLLRLTGKTWRCGAVIRRWRTLLLNPPSLLVAWRWCDQSHSPACSRPAEALLPLRRTDGKQTRADTSQEITGLPSHKSQIRLLQLNLHHIISQTGKSTVKRHIFPHMDFQILIVLFSTNHLNWGATPRPSFWSVPVGIGPLYRKRQNCRINIME